MMKEKLLRLKSKISEWRERYHRWQINPSEYEKKEFSPVHCNNCGLDFEGIYCPRCGQKGTLGRISWDSIREGVMDVWGLGSRSLPYSLWQLIWRPGYFVGDYISGKRQVSFPPVKMLFIVTIIYAIVIEWFFPTVLGITVDEDVKSAVKESSNDYSEAMSGFIDKNRGWAMLLVSTGLVLPMWVFFRYSPRHTRHTLPEGFFIMVFACILTTIFNFIGAFRLYMSTGVTILFFVLSFIVFISLFRQLFGYGLWGTLWRLGGVASCAVIMLLIVLTSVIVILSIGKDQSESDDFKGLLMFIPIATLVLALNFGIAYVFNRRSIRKAKRGK